MADIRAFRGFRYDLGKVGSLAGVVAPPYDVIDESLQQKLYDSSEHNVIRLELAREEAGIDKYLSAARTLNGWLADDILRQDTARSFYVYEQEFTVEGKSYTRRGFLARVRLEPFETGNIFPHEQTLSRPKADRLKLYQSTGFNISPVFGLYPDGQNEVFGVIEPLVRRMPPITATDHLGVTHRLWQLTDGPVISKLIGLLGPKPVFIADGHHRYETGLKYLEEQREAGYVPDDEAPANFCLMMLVSMSDPGLVILPTHRLLHELPGLTLDDWRKTLAGVFDIVGEYGTDSSACWDHLLMDGSQLVLGFASEKGEWLAARLKESSLMDALAPDQSEEWRSLAVAILHRLVLEKLVPERLGKTPRCEYVHLTREVDDAITAGRCTGAVLVPAAEMYHVESIAGNREKMPPKSTYFYPKLLTGLVLNSLKKD